MKPLIQQVQDEINKPKLTEKQQLEADYEKEMKRIKGKRNENISPDKV